MNLYFIFSIKDPMWSTKYFVVSVKSLHSLAMSCAKTGPLRKGMHVCPLSYNNVCARCACKQPSEYEPEVIACMQTHIPTNVHRYIRYRVTTGCAGHRCMRTNARSAASIIAQTCARMHSYMGTCAYTTALPFPCKHMRSCAMPLTCIFGLGAKWGGSL